ncbi:MAG: hypothetical protein KME15_08005 [Drouetiella hepatica Uher 2000/2452]|uniref:Uncharacterized protein n=1 Tax=Drouetiella hepatica Uher 2000/2452 TaxID=904376 RepID=A0A951Q9B3_9CYAN|nr:hypothetical protein [Drouetiella hepatica Uher 2000/2452]
MTNLSKFPVSAQLLDYRPELAKPELIKPELTKPELAKPELTQPGSPKLCNKPLKASPFESFRDPATGRWINYLPDLKTDCRSEAIESALLALQIAAQPVLPVPPPASELEQPISGFDRLLLKLRLAVSKYSALQKLRPLGKPLVSALRATGIVQTIKKFFTVFWVLAR